MTDTATDITANYAMAAYWQATARPMPLRGAAGQPVRLFDLIKGAYWTLVDHEVEQAAVPPRPGCTSTGSGRRSDVIDEGGDFRGAYAPEPGD
ncbi:hypothetical protein J2J97_10295 [Rhizobium bangladeshense]|uniref:hypothetical protein n=1 Tax=Rhizobium bangladeshense TaxID=1138189 RepID=UPI001A98A082|nr:hypothetical protein J2J97_10295 [Rhizobium bangladeshense]